MNDKIRRMKNIKKLKPFFDYWKKDNIIFNDFCLCPIHQIPSEFENKNQNFSELDYYLYTGYDVYILRLKNSDKNIITFSPYSKIFPVIYIIIEKSFHFKTFDDEFTEALQKLQKISFPKNFDTQLVYPY